MSEDKETEQKNIDTIGLLILNDGDSICEIVSDLRSDNKGKYNFMVMNPRTKAKYRIDVNIIVQI